MNYNLAHISRGTYTTTDNPDGQQHRNEWTLTDNVNVDVYTQIPENICLTYHFIYPELMNKIIMRLYDKENREFTFHQFESSSDGLTFSDLLSPGSKRKGSFELNFDERIIKMIRLRGRSNYGGYLNIVRFQAFYIPNVVSGVKY